MGISRRAGSFCGVTIFSPIGKDDQQAAEKTKGGPQEKN